MNSNRSGPLAYSFFERILRLAVFRLSVATNTFESLMMRLYQYCATSKPPFNPKRAENTLSFLKEMGAAEKFIMTEDGECIHALVFKSSEFEKELEKHGGKWIRIETCEKTLFAIVNEKKLPIWETFEQNLLRFGWKKEEKEGKEYLITCSNADKIEGQNLFLHLHSNSVAMTMITKRIGFYLGAQQDLCLFDPRGTWKSTGIATESGYYRDIEAIYEQIVEKEFSSHTLWLSGYCSGAYPVAHLWKILSSKGKKAHLILENTTADLLADFVGSLPRFPRWFANRFWNGLKSLPPIEDETGFSLTKCWKNKIYKSGSVFIIYPENDQRITKRAQEKLKDLVSKSAANWACFSFFSKSDDPHSDAFFHYGESNEKYWDSLQHIVKNGTEH